MRSLIAIAVLVLASACQTTETGRSVDVTRKLLSAGFSQGNVADLKGLNTPGDIRVSSVFVCKTASCGGVGVIAFGTDPETGRLTSQDLQEFNQLIYRKQPSTGPARRLAFSTKPAEFFVQNASTSRGRDFDVVIIDFLDRSANPTIYGRATAVYGNGYGRVIIAASVRRDVVVRFGGRNMLGI